MKARVPVWEIWRTKISYSYYESIHDSSVVQPVAFTAWATLSLTATLRNFNTSSVFRCAIFATTDAHPVVCVRRIIVGALRTSRSIVLFPACHRHSDSHFYGFYLKMHYRPSKRKIPAYKALGLWVKSQPGTKWQQSQPPRACAMQQVVYEAVLMCTLLLYFLMGY